MTEAGVTKKYDRAKFKAVAEKKPDATIAVMRDQMHFTDVGLPEMFKTNPEACQEFFAKLIGEAVNIEDEAHVTRILEAGVKDADSIADTTVFLYETFGTEDTSSKETETPGKTKVKKVRTPKEKLSIVDKWKDAKVPFGEGSSRHLCFEEMQKFTGTKKEFEAHLATVLEANGKPGKKARSLVATTVKKANQRGWLIEVGDTVTVTKVA